MRMRPSNAVCLLVAFFILRTPTVEAGLSRYSIRFREQLKTPNDLKLTGGHSSSSSVSFTCEVSWKPVSGSALHLFIKHSPGLDGSRSFLSISLNYGVLRSLRLDESNQSATEVIIPVPPQMLKPENEIVFSAEQFPVSQRSGEIWMAIEPRSFINIEYEETQPVLDLHLLPAPLLDSHSYRPKQLSVLIPEQPSSQTLEATALLLANYARDQAGAVTVHAVGSIDSASGPLLIVGTMKEQRVRQLEPRLGIRDPYSSDADEGIISLSQRSGKIFSPTLLVTGITSKAVLRAVRELIEGQFESGTTFARISRDEIAHSTPPREWKGFLPPGNHFTLSEMGLKEMKLDSQNEFSLSIPLPAAPDTQFLQYGHQMTLVFRLASGVSIEHSVLVVSLNGSSLGQFHATDLPPGSRTSLRLKIPYYLLRQQNVLAIAWQGLDSTPEGERAAWLLPSSEFDLPHDYESLLPNLGLLQYALFPFGLRPDFSDTVILLPNNPGDEMVAALFEFVGQLGRLVPSERFAFRVMYASELSRKTQAESHRIVFRIDSLPKGVLAAVEETFPQPNSAKSELSVTSTSSPALRAAIKTAFSEVTLKQLRGDRAYIYSDKVSSFKTTSVRKNHEYSYSTHIQAWLRENWIALPVILTVVSCLLFVGLRLALAQYKSRR
jgi:hypothetical protein